MRLLALFAVAGLAASPLHAQTRLASPDGKSFIASPIGVAWMEFAGTLEPGTEVWRAT